MELLRLERNRDRRFAREKQKAGVSGGAGSPRSPNSPATNIGSKGGQGTQRKCANCGQVGHIKTNKKYRAFFSFVLLSQYICSVLSRGILLMFTNNLQALPLAQWYDEAGGSVRRFCVLDCCYMIIVTCHVIRDLQCANRLELERWAHISCSDTDFAL